MAVDIATGLINIDFDPAQVRRATRSVGRQLRARRLEAPLRLDIDRSRLRREARQATRPLSRDAWRGFNERGERALREVRQDSGRTARHMRQQFTSVFTYVRAQLASLTPAALAIAGIGLLGQRALRGARERFAEAGRAPGVGLGTRLLAGLGLEQEAFLRYAREAAQAASVTAEVTGIQGALGQSLAGYIQGIRKSSEFTDRFNAAQTEAAQEIRREQGRRRVSPDIQAREAAERRAARARAALARAQQPITDAATGLSSGTLSFWQETRAFFRSGGTREGFQAELERTQQEAIQAAEQELTDATRDLARQRRRAQREFAQQRRGPEGAQARRDADRSDLSGEALQAQNELLIARETFARQLNQQTAEGLLQIRAARRVGNAQNVYADALRDSAIIQNRLQNVQQEAQRRGLLAGRGRGFDLGQVAFGQRLAGEGAAGRFQRFDESGGVGGLLGRLRITLGSVFTAFGGIPLAATGVVAAFGALSVVLSRFAEQARASALAGTNVAARRGVEGGFANLVEQVQTGTGQGLSDLAAYRTALNALRTDSPQIFENLEGVLMNVSALAAATGLTLEDASDRFFLGIRKGEAELLDELGIILRVQVAYDNYARQLGVAASELTPYQQRLAIATEAQRQLNRQVEEFGGAEAILETQQHTRDLARQIADLQNRGIALGESLAPFASALLFVTRGIVGILGARGAGIARARELRQEVPQISQINIEESRRNRILSERLGLLSKASLAGDLDIQQQRLLVDLQERIAAQEARNAARRATGLGGGAQQRQVSAANLEQAAANRQELARILTTQREGRERARIQAIQGPLNALLSSIEGGGRVATLSAEAYEDLTRNTAESNEARRLAATLFGLEVSEVNRLIEAHREETDATKEATDATRAAADAWRALRQEIEGANRFGPLLTEPANTLSEALTTTVAAFRPLVETLGEFGSAADRANTAFVANIPGATAPTGTFGRDFDADIAGLRAQFRAQDFATLGLELTAGDRFAQTAADLGIGLETIESNLASFVEGITFQGQSLRQALGSFLRGIAQSLQRSAISNIASNLPFVSQALGAGQSSGGAVTINVQGGGADVATQVQQGLQEAFYQQGP